MDALAKGSEDGLKIYLQIMALLIVMVALISLADQILAVLPNVLGAPITLERILGWLFAPMAWLYGVPWREAGVAGSLLGTKTILNELVAYLHYAALPAGALGARAGLGVVCARGGGAGGGSGGI